MLNLHAVLSRFAEELRALECSAAIVAKVGAGADIDGCGDYLRHESNPPRAREIAISLHAIARHGVTAKLLRTRESGDGAVIASDALWTEVAVNLSRGYGRVVVTDVLGNPVAEFYGEPAAPSGAMSPLVHPALAKAIEIMATYDKGLAQVTECIATAPLSSMPTIIAAIYLRDGADATLRSAEKARDDRWASTMTQVFNHTCDALRDASGLARKLSRSTLPR